jgi:hypothetical protein
MNVQVFLGLCTLLGVSACGIPAKVARIDDPAREEVKGIRYALKNPSYKVSLEFKKGSDSKDTSIVPFREFDVIVEQALESETVYEIRPSARLFSDTEIAIVLENDGKLSALTAGETDKISEIAIGIAGLAVTVGKGGQSLMLPDRQAKLEEHITKTSKLRGRQLEIERQLEMLKDMGASTYPLYALYSPKMRSDDVQALEIALEKVKAEIKENRFKLKEGEIKVEIKTGDRFEKIVGPDTGAWVTLQLTRIQ